MIEVQEKENVCEIPARVEIPPPQDWAALHQADKTAATAVACIMIGIFILASILYITIAFLAAGGPS